MLSTILDKFFDDAIDFIIDNMERKKSKGKNEHSNTEEDQDNREEDECYIYGDTSSKNESNNDIDEGEIAVDDTIEMELDSSTEIPLKRSKSIDILQEYYDSYSSDDCTDTLERRWIVDQPRYWYLCLEDPWFALMRNGVKNVDIREFTVSLSSITSGDIISFQRTRGSANFYASVVDVRFYYYKCFTSGVSYYHDPSINLFRGSLVSEVVQDSLLANVLINEGLNNVYPSIPTIKEALLLHDREEMERGYIAIEVRLI